MQAQATKFYHYRFKAVQDGHLDIDEAVSFIPKAYITYIPAKEALYQHTIDTLDAIGAYDPEASVLELAAGAGRLTTTLLMPYIQGRLTCTEPNGIARKLAYDRCLKLSQENEYIMPVIHSGTVHSPPPRGCRPTHVYSSGVLLYLTNEEVQQFATHWADTLEHGCYLIVKEPTSGTDEEIHETHERTVRLGCAHHAVYRTPESLWSIFQTEPRLHHCPEFDYCSTPPYHSTYRVYRVVKHPYC